MANTHPTSPLTSWLPIGEPRFLIDRLAKVAVMFLWTIPLIIVLFLGQYVADFTGFLLFTMLPRVGLPIGFLLFMMITFSYYMEIIRRQYIDARPWTFLQVRVPEDNERTPRAMEEVFNVLHGFFRPPDLYDIYLDGYVQAWMSAEIRGRPEGVSFFFRIPTEHRQLFEASVYAQYPTAEIEEGEDYSIQYRVEDIDKTWDLWAVEMALTQPDAYPIKTYLDFEQQFAEEERMIDSMAAFTEVTSSLDPDHEMWIQILFRPEFRDYWVKEGWALALRLAGREPPKKKPSVLARALGAVGFVVTAILPGPQVEKKRETRLDVGALRLTPGETEVVKSIQRNVSKVGFAATIRALSIGPKGKFRRRKRISQIFGIFRQFTDFHRNDLRGNPHFSTSRPIYGLKEQRRSYRKRRLLRRYHARFFRERGYVLNSEELATIFHFPFIYTKTPTLEHARARKGEPPPNVPFGPA